MLTGKRNRRLTGLLKTGALVAVVVFGGLPAAGSIDAAPARARPHQGPIPLAALLPDAGVLRDFYAARDFRPLWIDAAGLKPEARAVLAMLASAGSDGLDPDRYRAGWIENALAKTRSGDPAALATAELLLSRGYADYVVDLRRPPVAADMVFVDAELAPSATTPGAVLAAAGGAASLGAHLAAAHRLNPVYDGLRRGLTDYRARWSKLPQVTVAAGMDGALLRRRLGVAGADDAALAGAVRAFRAGHGLPPGTTADAETIAALNRGPKHYERLIEANMERARVLPADPGQRYILVDAAAARLWMYDGGRELGTMKVIVGKPGHATPAMAGLIRFATLNPYWNVPPDLVPNRIAKRVLSKGPSALTSERFELLSDWGETPKPLAASDVDWKAVASGKKLLRVRQRPGPGNMMGVAKFMMSYKLGIYLHDTPNKALFASADRRLSSGCVRVEDAARLGRWLFEGAMPAATGTPEQRADLREPVPVFITYLTAAPSPGGIVFRQGLDGRDAAAMARLARQETRLAT